MKSSARFDDSGRASENKYRGNKRPRTGRVSQRVARVGNVLFCDFRWTGGHATMGFFTFKLKRGGCFFFRHIEIIPERFQWLAIRFVSLISALGRYLSVRFQLFFCVLFILRWLFCDWREFWIGIVGYLHFMEISLELISSIISLDHPPLGLYPL